jgi:hypothetical protein
MHTGSLFSIAFKRVILSGVSNDLPGVGTTARQMAKPRKQLTTIREPQDKSPPITSPGRKGLTAVGSRQLQVSRPVAGDDRRNS